MFDVTDEIVVGDLSAVREERVLVPPTKSLKVRISKASVMESKAKDLKGLKLEVRIVEGIELVDQETGNTKQAFINKPLFTGLMDLCLYADPNTRNSDWYKKKQHLVEFSKLIKALGMDITAVKINDEFLNSLLNKEVLVDIQHEEDTVVNPDTKERVKTGILRERLRNWKKVA